MWQEEADENNQKKEPALIEVVKNLVGKYDL